MYAAFRCRLRKKAAALLLLSALALALLLSREAPASLPAWENWSGPVCRADSAGEKWIALSFETLGDGDTSGLLRVLDSYEAHATFFVEGRWAERHPEEVRKIAEAGHELGNHSWSHPRNLHTFAADGIRDELSSCSSVLRELTGVSPALFRPPYGLWSETLLAQGCALGMETVLWEVDSLDWQNRSPEEIARRVIQESGPGSILRFQNAAVNTVSALERVLRYASAQGFRAVTVSELLAAGKK